jgi:hypothetical protein
MAFSHHRILAFTICSSSTRSASKDLKKPSDIFLSHVEKGPNKPQEGGTRSQRPVVNLGRKSLSGSKTWTSFSPHFHIVLQIQQIEWPERPPQLVGEQFPRFLIGHKRHACAARDSQAVHDKLTDQTSECGCVNHSHLFGDSASPRFCSFFLHVFNSSPCA